MPVISPDAEQAFDQIEWIGTCHFGEFFFSSKCSVLALQLPFLLMVIGHYLLTLRVGQGQTSVVRFNT